MATRGIITCIVVQPEAVYDQQCGIHKEEEKDKRLHKKLADLLLPVLMREPYLFFIEQLVHLVYSAP